MIEIPVTIKFAPITEKTIIFDYPTAPFSKEGITQRLLKQKETFVIYLHTKDRVKNFPEMLPELVMRSGISSSWFIALNCFGVQQYPASIMFATIAVEALLNRDSRIFKYRKNGKWLNLGDALEYAKKEGIEVSDLKDNDGSFTTFRTRRNRIAHGDVLGYVDFLRRDKSLDPVEKVGFTETQALDQLTRSFNFIKKWAQSKPTLMMDERD